MLFAVFLIFAFLKTPCIQMVVLMSSHLLLASCFKEWLRWEKKKSGRRVGGQGKANKCACTPYSTMNQAFEKQHPVLGVWKPTVLVFWKFGRTEFVRLWICQNPIFAPFSQNWKLSESEIVKIGNCQNQKLEFVRISKHAKKGAEHNDFFKASYDTPHLA